MMLDWTIEPRLAYLVIDESLTVVGSSPLVCELLYLDVPPEGHAVGDICLPLAGTDDLLYAVLHGDRSQLALDQVRIDHADRPPIYLALLALPRPPGLMLLISDVTEQTKQQQILKQQHNELRLLHEQLAQRHILLERLNAELGSVLQRKSDMMAIVTHDMRSALAGVVSYMDFLREGEFGSLSYDQQEALDLLSREVRRLLQLLEKILHLRRLESDTPLQQHYVFLDQLIDQVISSFTDQARIANITLRHTPPTAYSPTERVYIEGDRDMLYQVVGNLVSNGIKYAGAGSTTSLYLNVHDAPPPSLVDHEHHGIWGELVVHDDGVGIAPDDLPRIFEPFYRSGDARKGKQAGSGLGLSIVQQAVKQHRGHIAVASTPGLGTTFTIWFPCELFSG